MQCIPQGHSVPLVERRIIQKTKITIKDQIKEAATVHQVIEILKRNRYVFDTLEAAKMYLVKDCDRNGAIQILVTFECEHFINELDQFHM